MGLYDSVLRANSLALSTPTTRPGSVLDVSILVRSSIWMLAAVPWNPPCRSVLLLLTINNTNKKTASGLWDGGMVAQRPEIQDHSACGLGDLLPLCRYGR